LLTWAEEVELGLMVLLELNSNRVFQFFEDSGDIGDLLVRTGRQLSAASG
jgi:hypothetical protein